MADPKPKYKRIIDSPMELSGSMGNSINNDSVWNGSAFGAAHAAGFKEELFAKAVMGIEI